MARLDIPSCRVNYYVSGPYILATPTFADGLGNHAIPKPVAAFLKLHHKQMIGVIGFGNRNFGSFYCLGARVISHKAGVPLLHKIELSGNDSDIEMVRKIYADCIHQGKLPAVQSCD